MFRVVRPALLGAMLFVVAVGCKKKDTAPTGGEARVVPPGTNPPSGGAPGAIDPNKKDLTDAEIDTLMAEFKRDAAQDALASSNKSAWKQLSAIVTPKHARRADMFTLFLELNTTLPRPNGFLQHYLVEYAAKEDFPEIVKLAEKYPDRTSYMGNLETRLHAMKDPDTIPYLGKMWWNPKLRLVSDYVQETMLSFGAKSEPFYLSVLQSPPGTTEQEIFKSRQRAISGLNKVGTAESLPALKALLTDPNVIVQDDAKRAIAAIEARIGKGKP